jgi:hypothetical protein
MKANDTICGDMSFLSFFKRFGQLTTRGNAARELSLTGGDTRLQGKLSRNIGVTQEGIPQSPSSNSSGGRDSLVGSSLL